MGHLETLLPPRLNAGYQFSNPTFARRHGSYRIAPKAASGIAVRLRIRSNVESRH